MLPCMIDPDSWYSDDGEEQGQAMIACLRCPLLDECQAVAQASPKERWGIWAGINYTASRKQAQRVCDDCQRAWRPTPKNESPYCSDCRTRLVNR
jgi:hypothetical protein